MSTTAAGLPVSTPAPQKCDYGVGFGQLPHLAYASWPNYLAPGEVWMFNGFVTGVMEDDESTVEDETSVLGMWAAATAYPTDPANDVLATLDVNKDGAADYITYAPESPPLNTCTGTPIFQVSGAVETDTGHQAGWIRTDTGYNTALYWAELSLTSVQMAIKIVDTSGNYDSSGYEFPPMVMPYPPSEPLDVVAAAGDGLATVSWSEPATPGAPGLTGYRVTADPGGATCETSDTICDVAGLSNGQAYTFTVVALSPAGDSPPSIPAGPVTPTAAPLPPTTPPTSPDPEPQAPPAPVAPSTPVGATATPGDRSATVTWAPPAQPGTHPVTGYTVTAVPGGATCTSLTTTCVVPGLGNGQSYTFTVVAHSAAGTSVASAPTSPVTPRPFAVVTVKARRSGNVLFVDVNPNMGRRSWKFRVEKSVGIDQWTAQKTYKTAGSKETRTINLKKGTYRVIVLANYGYQDTPSSPVYLRK